MIGDKFLIWFYPILLIINLTACTKISQNPNPAFTEEIPIIAGNLPTETKAIKCISISAPQESESGEESLFPEVNKDDHIRGNLNADVTIVEYGDFQCPGCAALAYEIKKLEEFNFSDFKLVFRHLPLYDIHDKALIAAQASEVASDEGRFWEFHDLLFDEYGTWVSLSPDQFMNWIGEQAASINLDPSDFQARIVSPEIVDRVKGDLEEGLSIGLRTTPFLLINGQIYSGPTDYKSLSQIIKLIRLGKRQFTSCPEFALDPLKQYIATLHTEYGDIVIQLFSDKAPFTVNSFVFLARSGWFDNITFHKVVEGIVYTGDPSGTGLGNPGYFYESELNGNLSFDKPGVVAMQNSGLNTNGSQFFITTSAQPDLNGRFTIFGQVLSGNDVLMMLKPNDPEADNDIQSGDLLIKVTIDEN